MFGSNRGGTPILAGLAEDVVPDVVDVSCGKLSGGNDLLNCIDKVLGLLIFPRKPFLASTLDK